MPHNHDILYGDDCKVHAFLKNSDGEPLRIASEQVDFQAFDSVDKAKKDAAEKCRHNAANFLSEAALMFRSRNVDEDLT